jgi:hypothetical protein
MLGSPVRTPEKPSKFRSLVASKATACWPSPTVTWRVVVLSLIAAVSVGCGSDAANEGSSCQEVESMATVHTVVELPQTQALRSADSSANAGEQPKLWLSVHEDTTTHCNGEYVTATTPGTRLLSLELPGAGAFDFDVKRSAPDGEQLSKLRILVLLDHNGNGECDEGDAMGSASGGGTVQVTEDCFGLL